MKPHEWIIDEETMKRLEGTKGFLRFYICKNCPATCCDGLDIDYNAPTCKGKKPKPTTKDGG